MNGILVMTALDHDGLPRRHHHDGPWLPWRSTTHWSQWPLFFSHHGPCIWSQWPLHLVTKPPVFGHNSPCIWSQRPQYLVTMAPAHWCPCSGLFLKCWNIQWSMHLQEHQVCIKSISQQQIMTDACIVFLKTCPCKDHLLNLCVSSEYLHWKDIWQDWWFKLLKVELLIHKWPLVSRYIC